MKSKQEALKILVVDDIVEYAMVMEMYFPEEAEILSVTTSEQAKRVFADSGPIRLAIVDIRLHETDTSDTSGLRLME